MNIPASRIDVPDDAVNGFGVLRQQLHLVAGERFKITQLMNQSGNKFENGRKLRVDRHARTDLRLRPTNKFGSALLHLEAAGRQIDSAKERVEQQSGPRQKKNE